MGDIVLVLACAIDCGASLVRLPARAHYAGRTNS